LPDGVVDPLCSPTPPQDSIELSNCGRRSFDARTKRKTRQRGAGVFVGWRIELNASDQYVPWFRQATAPYQQNRKRV